MLQIYARHRIKKLLNCGGSELKLRSIHCPNLGAIYFCNPKVAGSTIIRTLMNIERPALIAENQDLNAPHARAQMSSENNPRQFLRDLRNPNYVKFAFVRNPYTRSLSCYRDKIARPGAGTRYRESLGLPPSGEVKMDDFLERVAYQETRKMNRHWRPQSDLLPRHLNLDFLGKFENFELEFSNSLKILSLGKYSMKKEDSHATGSSVNWSEEISPRSIGLINEIYKIDFLRFKYEVIET